MEKKYLAVNNGSSSKKYALYVERDEICRLNLEKSEGKFVFSWGGIAGVGRSEISEENYRDGVGFVLSFLLERKFIKDKSEIFSIGLRVVAPGQFFVQNKIIDLEYEIRLKEVSERAPLHTGPIIAEIRSLKLHLEGVPIYAVSDSAFHNTLDEVAREYSLPKEVSKQYDFRRFGYHGISMMSAVDKLSTQNALKEKTIICHLGSGSSITALKGGKSFDTSMGFTPLEGLPMGTRIGDVDPGMILELARKLNLSIDDLENYLNKECGLKGLSGGTADVKSLLRLQAEGDESAKFALDYFIYKIAKYIGSYCVALGGLDSLVFTGAIGERSPVIRLRILEKLEFLGVRVGQDKNAENYGEDMKISDDDSKFEVWVLTANEMRQIALEAIKISNK